MLQQSMRLRLLASPNGFKTSSWGPSGWRFIHLIALNFPLEPAPETVRQAYYIFFNCLCHILPCKVCRREFCKMVKTPGHRLQLRRSIFKRVPRTPAWSTRYRIFKWTYDLHRCVNVRLHKQRASTIPMKSYLDMYLNHRAR